VFGILDIASGKDPLEVGVAFGKKALATAATVGLNTAFGGLDAGIEAMTDGIEKTVTRAGVDFLQGTLTNITTGTINSVTFSAKDGWGFDSEAYKKSVKSGLAGSAVQAVQTVTGGLFDAGIKGLAGGAPDGSKLKTLVENAPGGTTAMSNFLGGLAGQGVNAALGGDFTLNVLNLGFLANTGNQTLDSILSSGLLELHLGKDGTTMNIGTGGADASIGTVASVLKESAAVVPEAWKWFSETLVDNIGIVTLIAEKIFAPMLEKELKKDLTKEEKEQLESVFQQSEAARQQYTDPPPLPADMAAYLTSLLNAISDSLEKPSEEEGKDSKTSSVPDNNTKPSGFSFISEASVSFFNDLIQEYSGPIQEAYDKLNVPDSVRQVIDAAGNGIINLESKLPFTVQDGLYTIYRSERNEFSFKATTGNMLNSFPSIGIYGKRLAVTLHLELDPLKYVLGIRVKH
jgi:gas vesicle protein